MGKLEEDIKRLHKTPTNIRNIGIIAHIHHGKTALSDQLIAGAGMLAMEKAGSIDAMKTWTMDEERERQITIQSTGVSMVHTFNGADFLVNLIDTPGHVDFGGEVTRALRAVDGAVVVVCAVDMIMPQTEIVLKQALKERVKPVLFINKVDRLLKEMRLSPEQMQERFVRIINGVNQIIEDNAVPEFREKWKVSVNNGTVAFGSAAERWATSVPMMKLKNISFKNIVDAYYGGNVKEDVEALSKKSPAYETVMNMVVTHLPNPVEAQKIRIPVLWHGDLDSDLGKSLINCDPNGPLIFIVTKIINDQQAGALAFGRVFSGTLRQGTEVFLINAKTKSRFQQVFVMKLDKREIMESVPAGNIGTVIGLRDVVNSGETVTDKEETIGFEQIKHWFDPVVTKSIEAKNPQDLVKLIKVLKIIQQEDSTMKVSIDEETGQCLIAGLGELHLEIIEHKIERDYNVDIITSAPIVVYRETVLKQSNEEMGKSPNKHNHFYFKIEPLEPGIYEAMAKGELYDMEVKKKDKETPEKLMSFGMEREESKRVRDIFKRNILVDGTKGIVEINEVIGLVMDGFKQVMENGPLAKEPCEGIKVTFTDCKLHEDAIHRGPAQVYPAVREGIRLCFNTADPRLLEPMQVRQIDAPNEFMGSITKLVQGSRGSMLGMDQEGGNVVVKAEVPVADSFSFTSNLRSATNGRGAWFLVDSKYKPLPVLLQPEVIKKIRQRKGMKSEE